MTGFQIAALVTPALIAMALVAMSVLVRRQNKPPQFAPAFSDRTSTTADNLERAVAAADDRTVAQLARLNERLAANALPDSAIENLVRSSEIDRKLDLITDLLKSRARAT